MRKDAGIPRRIIEKDDLLRAVEQCKTIKEIAKYLHTSIRL